MVKKKAKLSGQTESENGAREKATKRAIERMQVARATKGFDPNWDSISSSRSLGLQELLSVIYALSDRLNSQRALPDRMTLIAHIEAALESGMLDPNLLSLMEWCDQQGYKLFPAPIGIRGRYRNSVAANKYSLQRDAEELVARFRTQGKRIPTKLAIASELLKFDKYSYLSADEQTVARNLLVTWK